MSISLSNFDDIDQVAGFEGPEKRLEIDFRVSPLKPRGLRSFGREEWQEVLNLAKCTIISVTSNDCFDSYVLSESSLFVFPYKVILKTCGTTTLLKTIPKMCALAKQADSQPEFLIFSRKNYNFPAKQQAPHQSFDAETDYLNQFFNGHSYVLGPLTGDHWHMYVADLANGHWGYYDASADRKSDQTLEIMMSDLDRDVMQKFYRGELTAKETTHAVGIHTLVPGSQSDELLFSPCGYSVNGLRNETYYTIHVTPEAHCSFVSFETNVPAASYTDLVRRVVEIFKPGRFCVSVWHDKKIPTNRRARVDSLFDRTVPGYELLANANQGFNGEAYSASFCAYRSLHPQPPLN